MSIGPRLAALATYPEVLNGLFMRRFRCPDKVVIVHIRGFSQILASVNTNDHAKTSVAYLESLAVPVAKRLRIDTRRYRGLLDLHQD